MDSPANASIKFFSVFVPLYLLLLSLTASDLLESLSEASDFSSTFTKVEAGLLQTGHINPSGNSPSCIYPQTVQRYFTYSLIFSPPKSLLLSK